MEVKTRYYRPLTCLKGKSKALKGSCILKSDNIVCFNGLKSDTLVVTIIIYRDI